RGPCAAAVPLGAAVLAVATTRAGGSVQTGEVSADSCTPPPHTAPARAVSSVVVFSRLFRSSFSDQFGSYARSSRTRSSYPRAERPLICQYPVRPGRTLRSWGTLSPYRVGSAVVTGRGPTRLSSPRITLISWG